MNNNLDPEIANLLGIAPQSEVTGVPPNGEVPSFNKLFQNEAGRSEISRLEEEAAQNLKRRFTKVTKILGNPNPIFTSKDFYNRALGGEGPEAAKFHQLFTQFLKAENPDDRSLFRNRVIPAYWDLAKKIALRISSNLDIYKRMLLRYGFISPAFLSQEQCDLISRIELKNIYGEPIYYVDEWLQRVAQGQERVSATDEVQKVKMDTSQKKLEKLDKRRGQRDAELAVLRNKIMQLEEVEQELKRNVEILMCHDRRDDLGGIKACYNAEQRKAMTDIADILRRLGIIDREMARSFDIIDEIAQELGELERSTEGLDKTVVVDAEAVATEFNVIRQMAKLCVGRKGNHFPVLMKSYFVANIREFGIRENVINTIAAVEELDPGLFIRRFREQDNRIVPNIILVPSYGEFGICWQPFEKQNRSTSRGRLAIPIFPKSLSLAVITALADLRWQVAKERAQHRWMEEGITGRYYMWFSENKMKGDVKDAFIRDYVLWITKESEGVQKLDREVRGIFWRNLPFPPEVKQKLKNRGFVYAELYKKDQNIAMSDGY